MNTMNEMRGAKLQVLNEQCETGEDRPLTKEQLLRQGCAIEASEQVPEDLRQLWSDLSVARRIDVQYLERDASNRDQAMTLAKRPLWVGASFKPRALPRVVAPRIMYRGKSLDPMLIWPEDDRRTYNDTNYPWGCVCRVLTPSGQSSGVLVGPRHVLTASHAIDWDNPGATIEVHRAGATVQATAVATLIYSYTKVGQNDYTTLDEDYAVIVTDQRLGDRFGWMGTRPYNSDWDDEDYWSSIGYASDVAGSNFPIHQRDQRLDEDEWDYGAARAMTTSADVKKGQSGSPMFAFWDNIPYVVAVVAAEGTVFASGDENWCAGGNLLSRLVNEARTNSP